MEYEHEVGEDDKTWNSNFSSTTTASTATITSTVSSLLDVVHHNSHHNQEECADYGKADKANDDAVVIASSSSSAPLLYSQQQTLKIIMGMMMTDNDNDNHNSFSGGGDRVVVSTELAEQSSGARCGVDDTLLKMCGGTSDNNHRLKAMQMKNKSSRSDPQNYRHEMEDSSRHCHHHPRSITNCNGNRCENGGESLKSPSVMLGRRRRTTTPKSMVTWWSTFVASSALLSVFLVSSCVANTTVATTGADNYAASSNNNSNLVDDSHQQQQQRQQSDKLTTGKLFKGLSVLEDINLIQDLEEAHSADFSASNDNELDDHNQHVHHDGDKEHYTHQWAVHILGGPEVAQRVAQKHGFQFHGEIFQDYYHLTHSRVAKRSIEPHAHYHTRLASEPEVRWLKQQTAKRRAKRDFLPEPSKLTQSSSSSPSSSSGQKSGGRSRAARRSKSIVLNDPRWPAMWYLNRGGGLDMNVLEAWNEGITGKGIVVTILDDGLEKDHPDIVRNYDPMASFDVNSLDADPMPTYDLTDSNRHGTRCAGEVAAEANNSICAVGIAYEAGVGGVRMLDGDVTDAVEARSLSHNPQHIDIYSASWGPDDDGKTVDGPGELATRAFMEGVTKGRSGKGSIFVWASGNGGRDHDNCNCDGYTNSIWTLSISSATENGLVPWYSEACSSTLATTYSSGGTGEKQIVTIDLHHSCTSSHTGTSASAPLAAGICALALQANTNLTWRDMQHIVVRTARPQHLIANDWATNGVGRNVSHSFGYGLMDAGAMVKLAKKWKTVPAQHKCEIKAPYTDKNIPSKSKVTLDLKVTNCPNVNYLEHVQAKVTLTSGRRGDLQIFLISPSGTKSQLLAHRRHDLNRAGFTDWPFMTVHSWGESPMGKWTLEIHNEGRYADTKGRTVLKRWSLVFYGTEEDISFNANYSSSGKDAKGSSSSSSQQTIAGGGGNSEGYSSYVVYTPRNSSVSSSVVDMIEGKGETGSSSGSGGGKNKSGRPKVKGKLLSKKQKGATSATPTGKPPIVQHHINNSPSESHVIITSDDEEFRQFLQSKFGLVRMSTSLLTGGMSGNSGGSDGGIASNTNNNAAKRNFGNWTSASAVGVSAAHALVPIIFQSEPKDEAHVPPHTSSSSTSTSTMTRASSSSQELVSSPIFISSSTTPSQRLPPLVVNLNSGSSNRNNASLPFSTTSSRNGNSTSSSSATVASGGTTERSSSGGISSTSGSSFGMLSSASSSTFSSENSAKNIHSDKGSLLLSSSSAPLPQTNIVNQSQTEQGKLQTWSLIAHGITTNPNDLADGSGIGGEGENTGGDGGKSIINGNQQDSSASGAVVEQFDGSDNTISAGDSSSLQNSGAPLPAHAGVAKPVSIVGRPSAPASSSAADCAKMSAQGQCLECLPGLALLHGGCVSRCPETFYVESRGQPSLQPDSTLDSSNILHYVCLACHYSCQTCSGPSDDECVTCYEDAKLHRITTESVIDPRTTTDKAHCYPLVLMDSLDRSDLSHRILLAVVALSLVFIVFILSFICCDCCRNRNGAKGEYGLETTFKKGWRPGSLSQQPYKRIAHDEDDVEEDELHYDDQYRSSSTGGGGKGRRGGYNSQTHLELISEGEDEDGEDDRDGFEHLNASNEPSTSRNLPRQYSANPASSVIPPKVPLVLHSHTSGRATSSNNSSEKPNKDSDHGSLV